MHLGELSSQGKGRLEIVAPGYSQAVGFRPGPQCSIVAMSGACEAIQMEGTSPSADIQTSFQRIRRNLLVISMVAIFGTWAGVEIPGKVEMFGASVTVRNPGVLFVAFWMVLVYWWWRFYQYSCHLGDKGWKDVRYKKMDELAIKDVKQQVNKDSEFIQPFIDGLDYSGEVKITIGDAVILGRTPWVVQLSGMVNVYGPEGQHAGTTFDQRNFDVNQKKMWWYKLRSWAHLAVSTRLISEYVLPHVLSLAAVVVGAYGFFSF